MKNPLKIILCFFLTSTIAYAQKSRHEVWAQQLQRYVSPTGQVNYFEWKKEQPLLDNYIKSLEAATPKPHWQKNEKLAFWINAYNALTVQLILNNLTVSSIKEIKNPWDTPLFWSNGEHLSLGDIEHQILRKLNEPRIHFAINCASASCPKLSQEPYTPRGLEQQLQKATTDFLCDTTRNQLAKEQLKLSKIFLWFSEDFGSKSDLIRFIKQYTHQEINPDVRIRYLKYNWALND